MKGHEVFVPGHVSLGFEPIRDDQGRALGSIGFGVNLTLGAHAAAAPAEVDQLIVAGVPEPVVTMAALQRSGVLGHQDGCMDIRVTLDLPVGAGFGMSAAGTIAALAAQRSDPDDGASVWEASHWAEIEMGCGLGDVVAIQAGGWATRRVAGPPGIAQVDAQPGTGGWLVATQVGRPWRTKDLLEDPLVQARLTEATTTWTPETLPSDPLGMLAAGRTFSRALDLHPTEILSLCDELDDAAPVHLGPSIFARDTALNRGLLADWAIYPTRIAPVGPPF